MYLKKVRRQIDAHDISHEDGIQPLFVKVCNYGQTGSLEEQKPCNGVSHGYRLMRLMNRRVQKYVVKFVACQLIFLVI